MHCDCMDSLILCAYLCACVIVCLYVCCFVLFLLSNFFSMNKVDYIAAYQAARCLGRRSVWSRFVRRQPVAAVVLRVTFSFSSSSRSSNHRGCWVIDSTPRHRRRRHWRPPSSAISAPHRRRRRPPATVCSAATVPCSRATPTGSGETAACWSRTLSLLTETHRPPPPAFYRCPSWSSNESDALRRLRADSRPNSTMPTSPWRRRRTHDVPFSPDSITPTSPKLLRTGKFRGSRRNGIWAKGDVTANGKVSIVEFGLHRARCLTFAGIFISLFFLTLSSLDWPHSVNYFCRAKARILLESFTLISQRECAAIQKNARIFLSLIASRAPVCR